jgi:hypothetical protein
MASFLTAFDAQLVEYLAQLEMLQEKNQTQHTFQPTFWMQQSDFDVAREVFVAVCDLDMMKHWHWRLIALGLLLHCRPPEPSAIQ